MIFRKNIIDFIYLKVVHIMSKKQIGGSFIILAFIICVIVFKAGITVGIYGVFHFTTDFSPTPEAAIMKYNASESSWDMDIEKTVGVVKITDSMHIYIGLTDDDEIFVGDLLVKDGKFHAIGNGACYLKEHFSDESLDYLYIENFMSWIPMYHSNGIASGKKLHFIVIFDGVENHIISDHTKVIHFSDIGLYEEVNFIYYVE